MSVAVNNLIESSDNSQKLFEDSRNGTDAIIERRIRETVQLKVLGLDTL